MARSVFDSTLSQHIVMPDLDAATAVSKFPSRYSYHALPANPTDPTTVSVGASPFVLTNRTGLRAEAVIAGGTMSAISHSRRPMR